MIAPVATASVSAAMVVWLAWSRNPLAVFAGMILGRELLKLARAPYWPGSRAHRVVQAIVRGEVEPSALWSAHNVDRCVLLAVAVFRHAARRRFGDAGQAMLAEWLKDVCDENRVSLAGLDVALAVSLLYTAERDYWHGRLAAHADIVVRLLPHLTAGMAVAPLMWRAGELATRCQTRQCPCIKEARQARVD